MHQRRVLLLTALLGLVIGFSLSPAPPAKAQVRLDVLGSSFHARQVMSGTELVIAAVVRNPSDSYVFHVSGRYSLKIGGQEVGTSRAGFALKDVLAPGETTILQKTVGHPRALEIDAVDIPFVVTDETTVASHSGFAPPPTVLRLDRGSSEHWGDHYLAELRNDSLVDYYATSVEVPALSSHAVFYRKGQVVGIALDSLVLPEGHVRRGAGMAVRYPVPSKASDHDDVELYFSVRQPPSANAGQPQAWAIENTAFSVEGSGQTAQIYLTSDLRNASPLEGDPDLAFLLKDAAGRLLGLLHCPIDLLLLPEESIACKEVVPATDLNGPPSAVASVSGMAMSHVLVPAAAGGTASPTATRTRGPEMTCTPPACPCGRLVGQCPSIRCEVCTPTPAARRVWLPLLRRGQ